MMIMLAPRPVSIPPTEVASRQPRGDRLEFGRDLPLR
jgi:hypothetical protein